MPVAGKMEVIIKISEFPQDIKTTTDQWKQFVVEADGKEVTITVKPKNFNKLEQSAKQYPLWVAAINGKVGSITEKGFNLIDVNIQVFERKPKAEAPPAIVEP